MHRRVERLGEHARGVLSSAAVIGREFDLDLLVRVVREDHDELIDLLDAAVEASLLQERADRAGAVSFGFAHNLINHTLYDALGPSRRARLHRRVAEALEDLCGDDPGGRVAELARHWTAATAPVEPGKAIAYSRRAGERALAELAPDEAARWFAQALELTGRDPAGDDADRCELAIRLGEAQRQAGQPPSARRCSAPPAWPTGSTTPTGWPAPRWPTTAASRAPSGPSTPSASRCSSARSSATRGPTRRAPPGC